MPSVSCRGYCGERVTVRRAHSTDDGWMCQDCYETWKTQQ